MKFTQAEYEKMLKKLEYSFKKSGDELISKIEKFEDLSDDEVKKVLKKLEYRFRQSQDDLIKKLTEVTGEVAQQYSSISAKKKRDEREAKKKEEKEAKKTQHVKEFNQFVNENYENK